MKIFTSRQHEFSFLTEISIADQLIDQRNFAYVLVSVQSDNLKITRKCIESKKMKEIRKENLIILWRQSSLHCSIKMNFLESPEKLLVMQHTGHVRYSRRVLHVYAERLAPLWLLLNNESWFSIKSTYLQNCFSRYMQRGHSWIKGYNSLVRRIYRWIINSISVPLELSTKFSLDSVSLTAFIKWIALQITFRI